MVNFSTTNLDQLRLEARFSFKPTSSSLYGALGDNLPVNTTVLPTPTPPHQPLAPAPAQHYATPISTGTVNPPTAGAAAPSALPTATQLLATPTPPLQPPVPTQHYAPPTPTSTRTVNPVKISPKTGDVPSHPSNGRACQTASLPQGAKKSTTTDLNQGHAHPRSSLKTVSQEESRQATGRRKSTSLREHRAGSGNLNSHYRKIAPKPDHRRKEKEETENGSPTAGACATPGFRMIRPRPQVVGS